MDEKTFECLVMDWGMFYRLAKQVADKINKSGYQPDVIVGLARGGWVLARVLCDFVGVKDLVSLKVEHWGVTATPDGTAKIRNEIHADLQGKKVLIVDDLTDTGESMRVAVEYIKSLGPVEVRTASLQHLTCAKFKSDYVGEELPWVWVIFPWNLTEDLCTIVPKACRRINASLESADVTPIKNELKQSYSIDTTEEAIADILTEIKRRNN